MYEEQLVSSILVTASLRLDKELLLNNDRPDMISTVYRVRIETKQNELCVEKTCFLHMQNKGAVQLQGNRAADQHLCFCHIVLP